MNDLERKLASLTPAQRELLEQRLKEKEAANQPQAGSAGDEVSPQPTSKEKDMKFSLIFFSGDGSTDNPDKYKLLMESTKFGDRHGFSAVWTPERHFQSLGGLYPNPAVLSAALAAVTENIQIRAGSVVLPLHHPIRVAEDWSIVDNVSHGRVAISVATGWHPADFVLYPENFENRKAIMFDNLDLIRRLWRGESATCKDISGADTEVSILPRPVQSELPIFMTASGNPGTWMKAGEMGFHVLCSLANHPAEGLKERIQMYRDKRREHGHDPDAGIVSVMLHTYVGETDKEVKDLVRAPMRDYLVTYLDQYDKLNPYQDDQVKSMLDQSKDSLINFAFEKYFQMSSLMGSKEKCAAMVDRLKQYGVDEIACLLDFGLEVDQIMKGLEHLKLLKDHLALRGKESVML